MYQYFCERYERANILEPRSGQACVGPACMPPAESIFEILPKIEVSDIISRRLFSLTPFCNPAYNRLTNNGVVGAGVWFTRVPPCNARSAERCKFHSDYE